VVSSKHWTTGVATKGHLFLILSNFVWILSALPARSEETFDRSASAAVAGEVAHKLKRQRLFPDRRGSAQVTPRSSRNSRSMPIRVAMLRRISRTDLHCMTLEPRFQDFSACSRSCRRRNPRSTRSADDAAVYRTSDVTFHFLQAAADNGRSRPFQDGEHRPC
jgi:hypothetical protein